MGNRLSYPVVDLSSRVAVVTGGSGGIGYETSKALAAMGAHTIIACRSRERAEEVPIYLQVICVWEISLLSLVSYTEHYEFATVFVSCC